MSWNNFHRREEVLRRVAEVAEARRDGVLPVGVPGVAESFADETDLVGALLLKWHARLSGNIEGALGDEPLDLLAAVAHAWRTTAEQMPGVRLVIDRCAERPVTTVMGETMTRSREQEWRRLASLAGLANGQDPTATAAGRRVEDLARGGIQVPTTGPRLGQTTGTEAARRSEGLSFVDRIKAGLAA